MKQIFLHIGTQKTGSSSIQFFLHENRERLTELGYLYPSQKRSHHDLVHALLETPNKKFNSNIWDKIISEIEKSDKEKIIISSEKFVRTKSIDFIKTVAEKLTNYDVKVIVYIKRQDKITESSFNQQLKQGVYTGSVESFLKEKNTTSYLQLLDNWSQYLDRENIIVRPLEKQQIPDIYCDFLKNIGIDSIDGFTLTEDKNVKPNLAQIIAINYINQMTAVKMGLAKEGSHSFNLRSDVPLPSNYPNSFFKATQNWKSKEKYNLIPYDKALEILEKSQEENHQIARTYLNREDGKLFYELLEPYKHDSLDIKFLDREQVSDLCDYIIQKIIYTGKNKKK
jgi:hypothetical protein